MVRVLGLALYGPLAASTRYRLAQFSPGLNDAGIDLQIRHFLGDDYLRSRYSSEAFSLTAMLRAGMSRLTDLMRHAEVDMTMVHCELFPLLPGVLERTLMRKPYIYDFDDAFYLRYQQGRMKFLRPFLGGKFDSFMAGAAAVTAGNTVLRDYALQCNAQATLLPTVVDTTRYVPAFDRRSSIFTIGWIGSPSTATYLPELVPPLSALGAEGPVNFVVIGGKAPDIAGVNVIEVDWTEESEVGLINTFDVGVMPLPDDDWARGKCAFKLIQYMACAVPVVASPVGANTDVVTRECGLLAKSPSEWLEALRILRDNTALRDRMGEAGRQRVVDHYSLHTALPKLVNVIQKVANQQGH